ncbi:GH3 auxin-responsive promoter family protein [Lusitaniella coriacea LEGE 07157]|uniref:GH3 auxin-responsive promoter family protein n=1 Tax=Lusitaniella coriacea LEGE 07157 TaxID=945747 RepID=A0A8J7DV55_9CYAN|nr:GH3 auxin-responsive promoter family protein [Lusitaniella coriacea]MBE9115548.1 GH3 auxin-responsive promoter family protein [Lusitaniella coriacea LEGE 07157]
MRFIIQLLSQLFAPATHQFQIALKNPKTAQKAVQKEICNRLVNSEYGNFLDIQTIQDWNCIPIVEYEDIKLWIENESNKNCLLSEPILFYEKTSGSRSATKKIPYTRSLRRAFNQMFYIWAYDLIQNCSFVTGKTYFCISPKFEESDEIADDSEYLEGWLRFVLSPFLVLVPNLRKIKNPEEFKEKLCLKLLQEEKLEIISIWSPTFLKVHLDYIAKNRDKLLMKLGDRVSPKRRQLLLETEISWTKIWSHLKLISCWDSAQAKEQADYLRSLFPNVLVQGKGLLATEAPITVPLIAAKGCVPLINCVFFEFEDEQQNIFQLHQIQPEKIYQLIISQTGGLYRYRMGDRVRISHYYYNTPCLEFLGRTETTSDLVGEKLREDFVRDAIARLELHDTFFKTLVPISQPQPHYLLLLDRADRTPHAIAQRLEQQLMEAYHYRHARRLGQLSPAEVLVSESIPDAIVRYQTQLGKTWGDIKHPLLWNIPLQLPLFLDAIA